MHRRLGSPPRWRVGLVILAFVLGSLAFSQEPEKLTREQRQQLQAKWKEWNKATGEAYEKGKLPEAEKSAREALAVARRLYPPADFPDGHRDLAASLNNLGFLLHEQQKYAEAEPFYRDTLAMQRRLHPAADHADLAFSLTNLGSLFKDQGKDAEAEPFYREALAVQRRLHGGKDHADTLTLLDTLRAVLQNQGKYADAEPVARDLLALVRQLHDKADHVDVARCLTHLGVILGKQTKYAEAETAHREALAVYHRLFGARDHAELASSLNHLGVLLRSQGKYTEAGPPLREALAMRRRLFGAKDHPDLANSLNNIGGLLESQGKYAEAEALLREALAMQQRLHDQADDPEVATDLANLAALLDMQGRHTEAEALFRAALAMRIRLHGRVNHLEIARCMGGLGVALQAQGRYADAEAYVRATLAMRQRLHGKIDHPDLANSMSHYGDLLREQGRYALAEAYLRQALAMQQRLHAQAEHPDLAGSLNNVGCVLEIRGEYAEAEKYFRDALAMRRRLYGQTDHPDLAGSLNDVGAILQDQRNYTDAEPFFRDALAMARRLGGGRDTLDEATYLNNLASVLQNQGRYAEAETGYRDALAMQRRLRSGGDNPEVARALHNLATLLHFRGKHADAARCYDESLAMYRRLGELYAGARSDGAALNLLAALPHTRDALLSNARLGRFDAVDVYPAVWDTKAALARAFERRHLTARAAATDPRTIPLLDQLTEARRRRADLVLAPETADPETRRQRTEEISRLSTKVQKLEADLRPLLPTVPRLEALAVARPDALRRALPPTAVVVDLLAYTFYEQDPEKPGKAGEKHTPSYLAFVLTRDKVVRVELGPAEPIDKAVGLWREAITGPARAVPAALPQDARRPIWDPIRPHLPPGVETVYLCPDGVLTQLPWAALPGDKPGTILLEDFALAVLPHAPFLLDRFRPDDPRPDGRKPPEGVLAVGGVAYDAAGSAPGGTVANRGGPPLRPDQQLHWPTLKGAEAEARGVLAAARARALDAELLDGERATAAAVLKALPGVRYAHLGTHGFFADKEFRSVLHVDPSLFERRGGERIGAGALSPLVMTGLVFAGANRPDTPGRGVVTGEALIDLDLSGLDLAVLSACETGLGDVAGGEGVFGLQRAFHVAGTRNVVASLWQVHDEATAALMALFYRNLWEKNLPPLEALRQAQLEVYRNPGRIPELAKGWRGKFQVVPGAGVAEADLKPDGGKAHPRLWAAFTLSGPGTLRPREE